MRSTPPYPHKQKGTVLVCGNAWCLPDDLERARVLFPDAPVIAVNGASAHVKAFALFTQHPLNFPRWMRAQQQAFGNAEEFSTHAAGKAHLRTKLGVIPAYEYVDYWWEGVASGGTSTWGARKMAKGMGFDTVILCGMPLECGDYAGGEVSPMFHRRQLVEHYRFMVERDAEHHAGCYSMSGWTKELLGAPE